MNNTCFNLYILEEQKKILILSVSDRKKLKLTLKINCFFFYVVIESFSNSNLATNLSHCKIALSRFFVLALSYPKPTTVQYHALSQRPQVPTPRLSLSNVSTSSHASHVHAHRAYDHIVTKSINTYKSKL